MAGGSLIVQARAPAAINFQDAVPFSNHLGGFMLTRKINSSLKNIREWNKCTNSLRLAFIREMRGYECDHVDVVIRFRWFLGGWKASDIARLHDTVAQVNTDVRLLQEY